MSGNHRSQSATLPPSLHDLWTPHAHCPRTILITGATAGVGLETARRLAATGDALILHARSHARGLEALNELTEHGADPANLQVAVADFAKLAQVRAMVREVARDHPRIDLLINNAATVAPRRILTEDGNELTFQVNYLAAYLLTRLLWDRLTPESRVINVSSSLHRSGSLHWGDPTFAVRFNPVAAYARAKLALAMFTKGLPEYGQSGPIAVSMHPGILQTKLMRPVYGRIGAPVAEGAAALCHLAAPLTPVENGAYYDRLTLAHPAPLLANRRALGRLWKLSLQLTGMVDHPVGVPIAPPAPT